MELADVLMNIIGMYNELTEISVKGDDVIRMADVLTRNRVMIAQLRCQTNSTENSGENDLE